jgi:hypothetical protein
VAFVAIAVYVVAAPPNACAVPKFMPCMVFKVSIGLPINDFRKYLDVFRIIV